MRSRLNFRSLALAAALIAAAQPVSANASTARNPDVGPARTSGVSCWVTIPGSRTMINFALVASVIVRDHGSSSRVVINSTTLHQHMDLNMPHIDASKLLEEIQRCR